MTEICVMEFDKDERFFSYVQDVKVSSVPSSGDKIVIDIDGIGHVFRVYDVLYADDERTDVYVIRQSTITDYNASGFPDIV